MADIAIIVISTLAGVFLIALCAVLYLFFTAKGKFKNVLLKKLKLMKEIKHDLNEIKVQNDELTHQLETIEEKTGIHIAEITGYASTKKSKELQLTENFNSVINKSNNEIAKYEKQKSEEKLSTINKKGSCSTLKKDKESNNNKGISTDNCEEIILAEHKKVKSKKLTEELRKLDFTVNQIQTIVESLLNESEKQNYCLQSFSMEQLKMQEHMQSLTDEMTKNHHTREIMKIQAQQTELASHLQMLQQQNLTKEGVLLALKNELNSIRRSNTSNGAAMESGAIVHRGRATKEKEYGRRYFRDSLSSSPVQKYPLIKAYTVSKPLLAESARVARSTEEIKDCLHKIRAMVPSNNKYHLSTSYYVSPPLSASSSLVGLNHDTPPHSPKLFYSNPFRDMCGAGKDVHVWKTSWRT